MTTTAETANTTIDGPPDANSRCEGKWIEMTNEGEFAADKRLSTRPRLFSHEDQAMYVGDEASLRQDDSPEMAIGKAVAARGYPGVTNASYEYHIRWTAKVAATRGFWRKLKVIVIG